MTTRTGFAWRIENRDTRCIGAEEVALLRCDAALRLQQHQQRRHEHERHDEVDHHADRGADPERAHGDDVAGGQRQQPERRRAAGAEQRHEQMLRCST